MFAIILGQSDRVELLAHNHLLYCTLIFVARVQKKKRRCVSTKNVPGAVCDLHADAVAVLASTLRGGAIAGSRPTQTGPARAASVAMTTRGPARPGAKASVNGHITDLLEMKRDK